MKPQYLFRWINYHGIVRVLLNARIRRGDPFARLIAGSEGVADPYPLIERLRGEGGIHRMTPTWVTLDHALCREILRDNRFGVGMPATFRVPERLRRLGRRFPIPPNPVDPPSMLMIDPPEHTRLRKPVASAFTPRAIGRLRDRVVTVTDELLAALPEDGRADLVADFAAQVPIAIISEMLGLPDRDRQMFLNWGDDISPLLDFGIPWHTHQRAMRSSEQVNGYLLDHIERLRVEPGDDILSRLVTAGNLTTEELLASATLLMGAGFETTVNLIGKGIVALLNHPDQLERLRAEPERWPNAVEEILRFDPPVQATGRIALTDVEVAGVRLRKGSTIVLSLAGANRDPAVFRDPDRFDIGRENAKDHLAFGSGIHVCLGASLARMEGLHALRALFERFPELRLVEPPRRRRSYILHGYQHMPAEPGRRVPVAISS
ncbi:cytochrome P450 [Nocardia paucivorans]|uniref:cytochrome P450 n=1 Tax=Nocardia paucivorans TaxID=114259 RepID=UPI0002EBBF63|nr:cytochrome P450 [Nocardia paucivorans]